MIRTEAVELSVIHAAAFRQKLTSGGSGITILRYDADQPGIASISKTSGKAIPADNTPADLYPKEAFEEALKLTSGLPYKKRSGVRLTKKTVKDVAPKASEKASEEELVLDSADYQKLVAHYTDQNGKLSYDLINRELIRFAHQSKIVRSMFDDGVSVKKIRSYIVTNRFRNVLQNDKLTDAELLKMAALLDEVEPKSVFKELDAELRKLSAARKKK